MRRIWLCVLAAIAIGCGSDSNDGRDSGTTSRIDSGAPADSGGSLELDSGSTPDVDSGGLPGIDSGTTPGVDSGTAPTVDSGAPVGDRDPRLTSDPDPNQVSCGSATCNTPAQACCTSLSGQMCTSPTGCTGLFAATGSCDGQEDCPGTRCCAPRSMAALAMGTTCAADCGTDRIELCGVDGDCDGGQQCMTCRPNTGPTGPTLYYGICVAAATTSCPSPFMNP